MLQLFPALDVDVLPSYDAVRDRLLRHAKRLKARRVASDPATTVRMVKVADHRAADQAERWTEAFLESCTRRRGEVTSTRSLKPADLAALKRCPMGRARLAGVDTPDAVDEAFAALYGNAPWLQPAINHLWLQARASALSGARGLSLGGPVLLVGPPGCGKTSLAHALARVGQVPSVRIEASAASSTFDLSGLSRGWGTARPGVIVETCLEHRAANPLVIIDELEKAPGQSRTDRAGVMPSFADALLPFLEPASADRFPCPFYGAIFNLGRANWIFTANSLDGLPAALLSRLHVIECGQPRPADVRRYLADQADRLGMDEHLRSYLDGAASRGLSMRQARRLAEAAVAADARPVLH